MYAIVKTGGKQYRVEQGQSLLVERLPASDGETVSLQPLLYVDGDNVVDGGGDVTVSARIVAHERGPKLRVVKFKPKRGYKRRTGHRQDLTRIEVTEIALSSGSRSRAAAAPEPVAASGATEPAAASGGGSEPTAASAPESAEASAPAPASDTSEKTEEATNGS